MTDFETPPATPQTKEIRNFNEVLNGELAPAKPASFFASIREQIADEHAEKKLGKAN